MNPTRKATGPLVAGLFLVLIGTTLLLGQFDLLDVRGVFRLWPLLLVGFGLVKLFRPADSEELWTGAWLLAIGLWLTANVFHLWGLTWRTSWPIVLILVGLLIAARALFGDRVRKGETGHAR